MTHAPEKITIEDWYQFCCYCNKLEGYKSGSTDIVIFRGHQDAEWELKSSLAREIISKKVKNHQLIYDIERELIDEFIKKWFPVQMKSYINHTLLFQILSIMQHYGIKTRMLDWTLSWLLAAYFATESAPEFDKKDAAVWCINKTQIKKRFRDICKEEEYEKRSNYLINMRGCEICWDQINQMNCSVRQPCNGQIRCNAIFFKDILSSSTDVRMIIQASVFTYCLNPLSDHIEYITKVLNEDTKKYCKKIIITKNLKSEFRERLIKYLESSEKSAFPIINQDINKRIFEDIMSKYQKK